MKRQRLSTRAWTVLMVVLALAVSASAAGLVLHLNKGSTAQAAPAPSTAAPAPSGPQPGSAQARADLSQMQSLLNSGSVSAQSNLLAPGIEFVPGSGPIVPAGKTIKVLPETFQSNGQYGTVKASVSDGTTVTLDLHKVQDHWYLYNVALGSAQTKAKVTQAGPIRAQLMSATTCAGDPNGDPPGSIGTRVPIILVHGYAGDPGIWSAEGRASMFARLKSMPGVYVTTFNYAADSTNWVTDKVIGPALADYIHCVAQASTEAGGQGKVIIVAHSMGGLATRFATTVGDQQGISGQDVADRVAMVVTIGTPNEGSGWANAGSFFKSYGCTEVNAVMPPSWCSEYRALDGMSAFGPKLRDLQELPLSIPLHAIAGDETYVWKAWAGKVKFHLFGDGLVTTGSALHKRPGGNDIFDPPVENPQNPGDTSAMHASLPSNPQVQQLVYNYINTYVQANPPAPVLGGDAYWLAGGGKWQVHGANLVISQGASGLTGTETWNAGGWVFTGHARLAFTSQPDGSLAGTYTSDAWYVQTNPQPAPSLCSNCDVHPPSTPDMLKGQTITLVPVAPGLAKTTYDSNSVPPWPAAVAYSNPYWCGADFTATGYARTQYCGA